MSYVTEVAELFLAHCPNVSFLGPADYTIVAEWEKQEIPLTIVFTAIEEGFSNYNDDSARIESIGYFHESIKQNYRNWLQTQEENA